MKQQRIALLLLLLLTALASCSPGHSGSEVIAFLRDGKLWTIDPNGANALAIVTQDTPVVGYGWSPTHQLLTFRTLDATFATIPRAKQLTADPLTGLIADTPAIINTIGVDGGSPIPVGFSGSDLQFSNAIWNSTGARLIYRQTGKTSPHRPDEAIWWVSQNDQPGGIAAKTLPGSYSIPSLSYTNNLATGNSTEGLFTTTLAGTDLHFLLHAPLAGHPLPASLERVLWQPAHKDTSILYAITPSSQAGAISTSFTVQLVQRTMDGRTTTLATCACTQFAWSPDGNHVLYSTGSTYSILTINDKSLFTIQGENGSVPYWSPDGQFLLLDGPHTLLLARIATKQQSILLSDSQPSPAQTSSPASQPATSALLQPVPNSIWAADSHRFLFLTRNRLFWQDRQLSKGLYTVTINASGQPQGSPVLVDGGNDTQPGWTYQDANTSFLY